MVARRLFPAFLIALLMSALLTWSLARRMAHPPAVAAAVHVEHLVAAQKDMNVGDTLDPSHLKTIDWPAAAPAGAFSRPQDLSGRVLLVPVAAGEPLLDRFLAPQGTGAGLMAKIPAGMRAVAVHADEVAGVAGFVTPDSFVDVLVTTRDTGAGALSTSTILQDVRVLARGQKTSAEPDSKPEAGAEALTLLLTPADAQKLTLAASLGKLLFVLRNGADRGLETTLQPASLGLDRSEALRAASTAIPAPQGFPPALTGKSSRPLPHADEFTVQTVAGGKQTDETFRGKDR